MSNQLRDGSKMTTTFQRPTNQTTMTTTTIPVSRPVYGAQHPPRHDKPQQQQQHHNQQQQQQLNSKKDKHRGRDSFQDFQEKTSDAWDDGDDDVLAISAAARNNVLSQATIMAPRSIRPEPRPSNKMTTTTGILGKNGQKSFSSSSNAGDASHVISSSAPNTPSHHQHHHRQHFHGASSSFGGPSSHHQHHPSSGRPPIIRIPLNPSTTGSHLHAAAPTADRDASKCDKFTSLFHATNIDLDELRKLSWSGIVSRCRPVTWKILSGYLPPIVERHESTLDRKRLEYHNYIEQYYSTRDQEIHQETYRQIQTDVPRMSPLIPLFQQELVQEIFERILYIWSIRHPASGYVQGINDLVTPFFIVFLSEYVANDVNVESVEVSSIAGASLQRLEADCFWCFSRLLDGIQDNYTFAQPGIQTRINSLKELVSRIDNSLHRHLERHKVEYLQFSFRWMNNLLMRELPLRCVIRLWDTYLSEPDGFASFHLYVCAAFLTRFSPELQYEQDFHGLMLMLQNLPTHHWTDVEIGLVLAEAYRLKYTFADAPKHFRNNDSIHATTTTTTATS